MKVQIDTIQCRRLYERLRSGRAQLEHAQRDVQHARMHLRAQTCPAQKQALRQAEQAIAALEEELERAAFRLFQIAGTYEMYEQSVQSQLRQLPALPIPMDPIPRQYRLPEVPARIRDILDARVAEPRREWIERLPVPPLPLLLLALPGDAAPQSWLTDAVLRRAQTQNEFSRTEDENEQI